MPDLLSIDTLSVRHRRSGEIVLHPLSLRLPPYRTLGIVGESGSGKTLLAKAILGLVPDSLQASGTLCLNGEPLTPARMPHVRGKDISLVVQHGAAAFDPLVPVGGQFLETLAHQKSLSRDAGSRLILDSFARVGLLPAEPLFTRYPHQLSGGQLQRMMIAMALALSPQLIIADEPTTALDAITQAGILRELHNIVAQRLSTLIFITHDIGLVRHVADDIAVMHEGRLVEHQPTEALWAAPRHAYTRRLLATRARLTARFHAVTGGLPCC